MKRNLRFYRKVNLENERELAGRLFEERRGSEDRRLRFEFKDRKGFFILMTRFLTMPAFARRLLFCTTTYRLTDRLVSTMVNRQYMTEVMLFDYQ